MSSIPYDEAVRAGLIPAPDPTTATIRLMDRRIESLEKLFEQRLAAIDKSIEVAHADAVRIPTSVEKAVLALDTVVLQRFAVRDEHFKIHDEKFSSIEKQFIERDTRTEQSQRDSKVAVDAALQAAKEAVGAQQTSNDKAATKIADSTEKLIGQQAVLLASQTQGLGNRIDAVKETIGSLDKMIATIQQALLSRTENTRDSRDNLGAWVAGAVLLVMVVGLAATLLGRGV